MDAPQDLWWQRLRQTPVTAALMAACILVYAATLSAALSTAPDPADAALRSLWTLAGHEEIFRRFGALELVRVWVDHEWWRVLTTGLLHGSLLHLVLNVWSLAAIGDPVERTWGPLRTLLLFIASSVAGCLASLVWCESAMVVGASAGVLGQAGALWAARRFGSPETQEKLADISDFRLGLLILVCLVLGAVIPGIAQAGHVGGLMMGAAIGWLWSRPHPTWRYALLVITEVGLLSTLVLLGSAPTWSANYHVFLGLRSLESRDIPTAVEHFQAAVDRDPDDPLLLNDIAYKLSLEGAELPWTEILARRADALQPDDKNILDTLGWIRCLQGDPEEGLILLRRSTELFGEDTPPEVADHLVQCSTATALPSDVPRETLPAS